MTIGINWAAIWNPAIWATPPIWSQVEAPPAPEPDASQTPAGRAKRRRRYFVEIDGQEFDVSGPEEAEQLLQKAKSLAQQTIEQQSNSITVKPGIKVPQIRTPNGELVSIVKQARKEILDMYRDFKRDFEIRSLMAKADEEEEEAIIRLLM